MLNQVKPLTILVGSLILLSTLAVVALGFKTDPYLKSTRTQLMKARAHLFAGEADKEGHRGKAVAFTTAAIDEVEAAMKGKAHHAQFEAAGPTPTSSAATFEGSHMRKALIHLKQAKENLGAAAPDQGGHRAKALELIDNAIEEVEKANAASD